MMIALLPLETIGSAAFFFTAKLSRNYFAHKYNLWNIVREIMSDIYISTKIKLQIEGVIVA
jgi:hypothetical protein